MSGGTRGSRALSDLVAAGAAGLVLVATYECGRSRCGKQRSEAWRNSGAA